MWLEWVEIFQLLSKWTNGFLNVWAKDRINEWVSEQMNKGMNERTDRLTKEQTNEWMNERPNEWMNEWMNEWERNESINQSIKGNDWQTNTWKEKLRKIKASWQILCEN